MDKVVYILGAGFSAPLGLPVMSNFIGKAKDLYFSDTTKYEHFDDVFRRIEHDLAYIGLFYNVNLGNIEEVLSILEMQRQVDTSVDRIKAVQLFQNFIKDVIESHTPEIPKPQLNRMLGDPTVYNNLDPITDILSLFDKDISGYIAFVLGLFNNLIQAEKLANDSIALECKELSVPKGNYSVITLNYDLVLEKTAQYISSNSVNSANIQFTRANYIDESQKSPYLAKLHGSVDNPAGLIAPTWNKNIGEDFVKDWRRAFESLGEANYIRVLGYSLPDNDAYVRYLLKTSILKSRNLKGIDVLCLDLDGTAEDRYRKFIRLEYPQYRFAKIDTKDYLFN